MLSNLVLQMACCAQCRCCALPALLQLVADGGGGVAGHPRGTAQLPSVFQVLMQEAHVMARLRHPAVVNFLGVCSLPACIITGVRCRRCLTLLA